MQFRQVIEDRYQVIQIKQGSLESNVRTEKEWIQEYVKERLANALLKIKRSIKHAGKRLKTAKMSIQSHRT